MKVCLYIHGELIDRAEIQKDLKGYDLSTVVAEESLKMVKKHNLSFQETIRPWCTVLEVKSKIK